MVPSISCALVSPQATLSNFPPANGPKESPGLGFGAKLPGGTELSLCPADKDASRRASLSKKNLPKRHLTVHSGWPLNVEQATYLGRAAFSGQALLKVLRVPEPAPQTCGQFKETWPHSCFLSTRHRAPALLLAIAHGQSAALSRQ